MKDILEQAKERYQRERARINLWPKRNRCGNKWPSRENCEKKWGGISRKMDRSGAK